jgi:hypothetical protein
VTWYKLRRVFLTIADMLCYIVYAKHVRVRQWDKDFFVVGVKVDLSLAAIYVFFVRCSFLCSKLVRAVSPYHSGWY